MDEPCPHERFTSDIQVFRIVATTEPGAVPHSYRAEVRVACAGCGERFRWRGVPFGLAEGPTASPDGLELRACLEPESSLRGIDL